MYFFSPWKQLDQVTCVHKSNIKEIENVVINEALCKKTTTAKKSSVTCLTSLNSGFPTLLTALLRAA